LVFCDEISGSHGGWIVGDDLPGWAPGGPWGQSGVVLNEQEHFVKTP
jgi:hypothetical protein